VIAAASNPRQALSLARSLGADFGINYTRPDWIEQLRSATDGADPDIIYEFAGGTVARKHKGVGAPWPDRYCHTSMMLRDEPLRVLIVYAHHEQSSFNAAMTREAMARSKLKIYFSLFTAAYSALSASLSRALRCLRSSRISQDERRSYLQRYRQRLLQLDREARAKTATSHELPNDNPWLGYSAVSPFLRRSARQKRLAAQVFL
jgi:hypothetical protein